MTSETPELSIFQFLFGEDQRPDPETAEIEPIGKTVAFDFFHHGHVLVKVYVQFLCSDWSKFER